MEGLYETLQHTTAEARRSAPVQAEGAERTERLAQRRIRDRRSREAKRYAADYFDITVNGIQRKMDIAAERGEDTVEEELGVYQSQEDFEQAKANRKTLRDQVAKYFTEQNFSVATFEGDLRERDYAIPLADGYSADFPPMMTVGKQFGLRVSWGDGASEPTA